MAQSTTLQLLAQVSYTNSTIIRGDKQPAAAYYMGNQDLQTLNWNFTSFKGSVYIQATLASDPNLSNDDDWFTVFEITGDNTTGAGYQNLNGNFVWLRAKVSFADYAGSGVIQYVKVSY
jgi:hypothetical protein